jgi:hypothetical protein
MKRLQKNKKMKKPMKTLKTVGLLMALLVMLLAIPATANATPICEQFGLIDEGNYTCFGTDDLFVSFSEGGVSFGDYVLGYDETGPAYGFDDTLQIYFVCYGQEWWTTDGFVIGTTYLVDCYPYA